MFGPGTFKFTEHRPVMEKSELMNMNKIHPIAQTLERWKPVLADTYT
jgi:hypothetical protein